MSRNLDLQAILDAPDSSSSSGTESDVIDNLPLSQKRALLARMSSYQADSNSEKNTGGTAYHSSKNYERNLDLEKILMENDDYDDDDDEDYNEYNNYLHEGNQSNDSFSLGASTIPTLPSQLRRKVVDKGSSDGNRSYSNFHDSLSSSESPPKTYVNDRGLLKTNAQSPNRIRGNYDEGIETDDENLQDTTTFSDSLDSPQRSQSTAESLIETSLASLSPRRFLKNPQVFDMPRLSSLSTPKTNEKGGSSALDTKQSSRGSQKNSRNDNDDDYHRYGLSSRNPEEWAVLQSILNDDNDNDDASFEKIKFPKRALNTVEIDKTESKEVHDTDKSVDPLSKNLFRSQSNTSSSVDVDAILYSMEDDSDDDANIAELDEMIAKFSLGDYNKKKSKTLLSKYETNLSSKIASDSAILLSESGKNIPDSSESKSNEHDDSYQTLENSIPTKYRYQHNAALSNSSDVFPETALRHAEEYERRLLKPGQRDIISPLMVKRRMKPKIELETKSRLQQQQQQQQPSMKKGINQFSQQSQGFDFSGTIDSKSMQRISEELHKYSRFKMDEIGLPTALSVSSKFIAIGTQRGIILVFDLFEELRQKLGVQIPGSHESSSTLLSKIGSVSSIDLSSNGENLVAGYTSGCIILWDVIKGTIVKSVPDLHPSPITCLRFISNSLTLVSIDAGGLVNKISFTKPLLWTTFNVESECLLDGTAGQVLAFSVLAPMSSLKYVPTNDKKQPYHPSINQIVLIALSSSRSSFAIAVEPTVSVLHRWNKPSEEQMNIDSFIASRQNDMQSIGSAESQKQSAIPDVFLPCLAWNWAIVSGGENSVTPVLARGWGCSIQFLRANFPSHEGDKLDESVLWPAFGDHDEFQATAPIVALEWMGKRSLLYLTLTNELTIVDTVMMTLTERLDFSGIKLVYAEFALSRNTKKQLHDKNDTEQTLSTTFQNSIRANEDRVLVLCQEEVKTLSIVEIQRRVSTLEDDGEWLEALALALDHYESTVKSQEDRRRDTEKDLINHPEFLSKIRKSVDEEWIAELLIRYLNLAVENAPESSLNRSRISRKSSDTRFAQTKIDLAQSHFQMLGGVCIEFCIVTRRLDLLFNDVYYKFKDSGYTDVFLDVLEPYVLNDKLRYIAPEVMSQFVEHCKITNDVSTVERCLLHMDVSIMDFDSILSLLRKNCMFSALIHVYTHGLDDFVSPLQNLFEAMFDEASAEILSHRRQDRVLQTAFERYGYKAILYLRYCFTNRSFPQGNPLRPDNRVDTMRPEILYFLLSKQYMSPSRRFQNDSIGSFRHSEYPYLRLLMVLDAKAFLDTLSLVFDASDVQFKDSSDYQESIDDWHKMSECVVADTMSQKHVLGSNTTEDDCIDTEEKNVVCPDRMDFARILSIVVASLESIESKFGNIDQYRVTRNAFYDFMAKYLLRGVIRAPPALNLHIISRMASRSAQDEIIKLLQVLPRSSYNRDEVLRIVENKDMTRAALLLYKSGVIELIEGKSTSEIGAANFIKAIECYLVDKELKTKLGVFDYVKKECIGGSTDRMDGDERTVHDVLRNALCSQLSALVNLDPVLTAQLVAEIYIEELATILMALHSEDEMVKFKFFHAIISGDLTKIDSVAGPVLLDHLTIDHHQQYLELMVRFHPEMVYQHLITHDNYRAEECLQLCQAHDIADATAYLLERMGNVSSALQLMLQTLEGRLMTLKRVVRGISTSSSYPTTNRKIISRSHVVKTATSAYNDTKEAKSVRQILTVALDLCERNSSSSSNNSGHGSQLWFNVLDRLINAKGFLRLSKESPEHSEIMLNVLSNLLKMTMERMVSNVALPDLVKKITTDHAGNRLGEFREMISTMLSTYGSELEVCNSAVNVMNNDVQKLLRMKYSLKVCGARTVAINGKALPQIEQFSIPNLPHKSVLHINSGKANVGSFDDFIPREQLNECHFGNSALNILRAKRHLMQTRHQTNVGGSKIQFGMMTHADKRFSNGESSDAAYMPRCIGILSSAEHYGKLSIL